MTPKKVLVKDLEYGDVFSAGDIIAPTRVYVGKSMYLNFEIGLVRNIDEVLNEGQGVYVHGNLDKTFKDLALALQRKD